MEKGDGITKQPEGHENMSVCILEDGGDSGPPGWCARHWEEGG